MKLQEMINGTSTAASIQQMCLSDSTVYQKIDFKRGVCQITRSWITNQIKKDVFQLQKDWKSCGKQFSGLVLDECKKPWVLYLQLKSQVKFLKMVNGMLTK